MKYLQLFLMVLFINACSGTKHIIENDAQKTSQNIVVEDSIPETNILENIKTITSKPKINDSIISDYDTLPIKGSIKKVHHNDFNKLLKQYVSGIGIVNYVGFKKKQLDLEKYISYLGENLPTENWTKEDKLAFWINAYNAFTIDLILRHYPIKSIKDIKDPWQQRYWKLGEKWYNLDDIEHQILRKIDEPRIHFAIVCASISCPKLLNEAYTSENLEQQLTTAAKDFLNDTNRNSISKDQLELSKIFKWFGSDFTKNRSLIDFLNLYSNIEISKKATKSYKDYNWDLNE